MAKQQFSFLAFAVVILCSSWMAMGQQSAGISNIPQHLLECYKNQSLYFRENRIPMKMNFLIDIIRKIESYPGFNMDLRGLALSLMHMFRVDGIEKQYGIEASDDITPFSLKGYQFYKYRILFEKLIPKSPYEFQNDSITTEEKCALHFMLSNSIDILERGDETVTCSSSNSGFRSRRDVSSDETENVEKSEEKLSDSLNLEEENDSPEIEETPAPEDVSDNNESKSNVEVFKQGPSNNSLGKMMWNQDGGVAASPGKLSVEPTKSRCPVENGVVYDKWGTVSAGNVLAGLASGLAKQIIDVKDIRKDGKSLEATSVDSVWAATLAGDLAEVALLQGPISGVTMKVGVSGSWNTTQLPRWYFISDNSQIEMTDAEIRGSIDGLIIATYVEQWNTLANRNLRLSTLLERYYSERGVFDPNHRACKRKDLYAGVAPSDTMKQQTYNFAVILAENTAYIPNIEESKLRLLTDQATQALNIASDLVDPECDTTRAGYTTSEPYFRNYVDLYVVIDSGRSFQDVQSMLLDLAESIQLHQFGSRMTVICGSNFETLLNSSMTATDTFFNISEAAYNKCQQGFNIKNLYQTYFKDLFNSQLDLEKNSADYLTTRAKVVLCVPYNFAPNDEEFTAAKNTMRDFRTALPDIKFIYIVTSSSEKLQELVEENDKDIILFSNYKQASTRIKDIHRRVFNPVCGSKWEEKSYNTAEVTDYVQHKGVNYYRIHPTYLFGVGSGSIKILGAGNGEINVCQSRYIPYPNKANSSSSTSEDKKKIECKTIGSETYEIKLSNACDGHDYILQCKPLYISIESVGTSSYNCNDNCQDVGDLKFTITHQGLTCGVGRILGSPGGITLIAVLVTTFKLLIS